MNTIFPLVAFSCSIVIGLKLHKKYITGSNDAFQHSCNYGHLEIAKWLLFVKPKINIIAEDLKILEFIESIIQDLTNEFGEKYKDSILVMVRQTCAIIPDVTHEELRALWIEMLNELELNTCKE